MSVSSNQASKFYEQSVKNGKVFTVLDKDSFLIFKLGDKEVVPFWSSQSRVKKVKAAHPKYAGYDVSEISLTEFLNITLSQLENEKISICVNWSGTRLIGYDVSIPSLRINMGYWIEKNCIASER